MTPTTFFDAIKTFRRDLHEIPEIGFDLPRTHAYLKARLHEMGYETTIVAETGLIALKKGASTRTVAFRADMDALEIQEQTGLDFVSKNEGRMHACGHDGHMAMLLGFAKYLADNDDLNKQVAFIFEPAEETYGGAREIIKTDLFRSLDIEAIFALHLDPDLEEGKLGLADGILTAQDGDFDMVITGMNAHSTQPHLGHDTVLAAAQLVSQYHTIVSRSIDPLTATSINVGTLKVGEGRNIIANKATLTGSIRAFDFAVFSHLKKRMREIDKGIETAFNVTIENTITDLHPPVENDHDLFTAMTGTFAPDEYTLLKPLMLAEDFSYYQQAVPGMFIMLGSRNIPGGFIHPLHSGQFNFDETVLMKGVDTYIRIATRLGVFK